MIMTPEKWQRYIDGECTEPEKKEIIPYLQSLSPAELEAGMSGGWKDDAPPMPGDSAARMDAYVSGMMAQSRRGKVVALRNRFYWAAAGLLLAAGVFPLWEPLIIRPGAQDAVAWQVVSNTGHDVQKVTLPDSSSVWLTPHSELRYAAEHRTVLLNGEAYFEVRPHAAKPFRVETGEVQTLVLGTHFNIESYGDEAATRVSLTDGKIAVTAAQEGGRDSTLLLAPGQRLVYHGVKKQFRTETFDKEKENAWKKGFIVLNDLEVREVFRRLERRFGKKIRHSPGMFAGKRFSAVYPRADLDLILQNMAFVQDFRYTIHGDSILIRPSK